MFKGSGIFMVILLVLMVAYYLVAGIREKKAHETGKLNREKDSISKIEMKNSHTRTILDSILDVNYLTGHFDPSKEISFTEVDLKYGICKGLFVREETYGAFIKMHDAAMKDGISLSIISATRNFNSQKGIWEAKWTGKKLVNGKDLSKTVTDPVERAKTILKYSSMPGTSRHHWGTDVDLNSVDPKYFETADGKKIYNWLLAHASEYGFCQPYTAKGDKRPTGYEEEKWHWSFMPVARQCLNAYKTKVTYDNFKGFLGCETAEKLKVIEDYVLSVNPDCR